MRYGRIFGALALVSGCLIGSTAMAADWQIATVSGKAFRLEGAAWVRIAAGDPLALGDTVKTLGSATLTLVRDGVTVTVAPNSQVQIKERLNGKFTDVLQAAGNTDVEVDPAKHIRLAVETPYMAAVVKGTVFSVSTFKGYSETAVRRGRVAVIDVKNRLEVDVTAGQKATSGEGQPLSISGTGKLATPEAFKGKVVAQAADGTLTQTTTNKTTTNKTTTDKTTETVNGAGKTVSSNAGGNSNGAGNSESSNAGGNSNSNGNSNSSNAGGNSDHSHSDHSNSDHSNSDHSHSDHSHSDHSHSDHSNSDHSNSGNGKSK